ncbi:riboflavin synthase [Bacillus sp. PS06]|uniref:riboflavin synthase n=1 Tax=Bacillus sp. PS06 TaxID=2764176 RepID=UPI0017818F8E|nr:riboflavin synthase [Bacillus sp. PS06]MBD8070318.1 riboflavin synthase [Bacillus sp. PS06]
MFTGIIEEIGTVSDIQGTKDSIVMKIKAEKILVDVALGDSIAVNGVCLTVTSFSKEEFSVDVMPETVKSTSLQTLKKHSSVNLERAMSAGGRFGGHFVSGHVDGIGKIVGKEPHSNAVYYSIKVKPELIDYMIPKGSITVDGTSLTIFGISDDTFMISLIPHTVSETIIGEKGIGDIVNIECDMLGKYVEKFVKNSHNQRKTSITSSFLEENGFK